MSPPASSADVTSSFAGTSQLFSSQGTASVEGEYIVVGTTIAEFGVLGFGWVVLFWPLYVFYPSLFLLPFISSVSSFINPVTHASCPEVFSRTMTTNMFLEVASVVCHGVQVAVTSFSSSLAGKVAVAILFEILRCSCLLGFSVQLSFGVATLRICIRPRRPLVSGARRIERAMRPTCALAVVQDLETHCAGMTRVSMRPVSDFPSRAS